MANNYSLGTIKTNFNTKQALLFLNKSGEARAEQFGEKFDVDEHTIFEHADSCFWNMESFDIECAEHGINAVFAAFPNEKLFANMGVAFVCDKPRMGEFGGYSRDFFHNYTPT